MCRHAAGDAGGAIYLAVREPGYRDTSVGRIFAGEVLPVGLSDPDSLVAGFFEPDFSYGAPDLVREVFGTQAGWCAMRIEQLAGKRVTILGFGREGRATLGALRRFAPGCEITIADEKPIDGQTGCAVRTGLAWLSGLDTADVVIKSPGIPRHSEFDALGDKLTSATRIFLDTVAGSGALVIGVTGSKGKSTTSSLIYAILREAGRATALVGNIGAPALEFLDRAQAGMVFVMELSSYQLLDLTVSPPIAVLTSIFPRPPRLLARFA